MMIETPEIDRRQYYVFAGMILFFIVGFLASYFWMNAKMQKVSRDCETKLAEAKKEGNCIPQAPNVKAPDEVFSASGTVESIDGQKIVLKGFLFGIEKTYQVTVDSNTKITKREMDLTPSKENEEGMIPPPTSKETNSSLEDIRAGDNLTVNSDENIMDKAEFTAKSIYIEITTGLPAPPSPSDAGSAPALPETPSGDTAAPPAPAAPPVPSDVPPAPAAPSAPAPPLAP